MASAEPPYLYASATDTGRARSNNEDALAVDSSADLAVLADGMGGYNAGEVASRMTVDRIAQDLGGWLRQARGLASDADVKRALQLSVERANREVYRAARARAECAGMGTTLVLAVFREGRVIVGHIGDSRAYRWRGGQLQQLTRDHSLLQEQLDAGLLSPQEAAVASHKNLVTRALGVDPSVPVDISVHGLQSGDGVLLCSDGLSDMLASETLGALLQAPQPLPTLATALVQAANDAGGRDNISVVLARAAGEASAPRSWWPFRR